MKSAKLLCLLFALACGSFMVARPSPLTKQTVDFERDIRPLLHARCVQCHGAAKQNAGLRFDSKASALKVIVPGQSSESELIRRVMSTDRAEMMPPAGERLSPREIALLKAWIDAGALWPEEEKGRVGEGAKTRTSLWSLQPLRNVGPPTIQNPKSEIQNRRTWGDMCHNMAPQIFDCLILSYEKLIPFPADGRCCRRISVFDISILPASGRAGDRSAGTAGRGDESLAVEHDRQTPAACAKGRRIHAGHDHAPRAGSRNDGAYRVADKE